MVQMPTTVAAANEEPSLLESLPEEGAVARDRRSRMRGLGRRHAQRRGLLGRAKLQDPEAHAADEFTVLVGEFVAVVEEVSGAKCGAFLVRDVLEKHPLGDQITGAQVA